MSVLFKGCVFIIYSLVIPYNDDYIFSDLSIFRFMLVLLFVVSIMFVFVSPNVIYYNYFVRLVWFGFGFLFVIKLLLK